MWFYVGNDVIMISRAVLCVFISFACVRINIRFADTWVLRKRPEAKVCVDVRANLEIVHTVDQGRIQDMLKGGGEIQRGGGWLM